MTCKEKRLKGKSSSASSSHGFRIVFSEEITEDIRETWDALARGHSVFLHSDYLTALADGSHEVKLYYARFERGNKLFGIAVFQLTTATACSEDDTQGHRSMINKLARSLLIKKEMRMSLLVLGNSFATGPHGFAFQDSIGDIEKAELIVQAASELRSRLKDADVDVDATLIKDFHSNEAGHGAIYVKARYARVSAAPNLLMPLPTHWESFDDYLSAMTSKYRTKAKAALRRSESLDIRVLDADAIASQADALHKLYCNVKAKASLAIGAVGKDSFEYFSRQLNDRFIFYGYYLDNNLVGFQCAFNNGDCLDAHLVGFDYDLNQQHAIYPRMLYEYIRYGIKGGFSQINFGRTATEIKSTVGAFPTDTKAYLRHSNKASNTLLNMFGSWIDPQEEKSHTAFKVEELKRMPFANK